MRKSQPAAFVTYGWCRTAYAVAQSLGKKGIDVHVGDHSSLAMTRFSKYCKSFTRLNNFFEAPDEYFDRVINAIHATKSQVLIPCHEDVGIFSQRQSEIPSDIKVVLPDYDKYVEVEDKWLSIKIAEKIGCPTPSTCKINRKEDVVDLAENMGWPVVIKTRITNSAKGVRIARNPEELINKYDELINLYGLKKERWPVIQEFLPGKAVGVCLIFNKGKYIAGFMEEYIRCKEQRNFGTSTLRKPFNDDNVLRYAKKYAEHLDWHGVMHMDFIADGNNVFKFLEINPRFWGALALAVYAGVDFPYSLYRIALAEKTVAVDDAKCDANILCRWIIGDFLGCLEALKRKKPHELLHILQTHPNCYHDDFSFEDPLPLLFEGMDYLKKFLKSKGSFNPVLEGMVR